jgi:hypothetical protein
VADPTDIDPHTQPPYLLRLFQEDMVRRLTKAGIEAVRPAIERAAHDAVMDMQAQINIQADVYKQETVVHLTIKDVK